MSTKLTARELRQIKAEVQDLKNFVEGKASSYTRIELPVPAAPKEVKAARQAVHQTQRQFARVLGVSLETVKAWESGRRTPEGVATKVLRLLRRKPGLAVDLAKS